MCQTWVPRGLSLVYSWWEWWEGKLIIWARLSRALSLLFILSALLVVWLFIHTCLKSFHQTLDYGAIQSWTVSFNLRTKVNFSIPKKLLWSILKKKLINLDELISNVLTMTLDTLFHQNRSRWFLAYSFLQNISSVPQKIVRTSVTKFQKSRL